MSLSIVQAVFILFVFLSFQEPGFVVARHHGHHGHHGHHSQLNKMCSGDRVKNAINPHDCSKILQSHKNILHSKNPIDLSIAIIESGISRATNTQKYIRNKLKKGNLDPVMKGVLVECNTAYNLAIGSFRGALSEVKEGEYLMPTYELLIASTDQINMCNNAFASKRVRDATISTGNRILSMFGFIGFNVVNDLEHSHNHSR